MAMFNSYVSLPEGINDHHLFIMCILFFFFTSVYIRSKQAAALSILGSPLMCFGLKMQASLCKDV